MSWRRQVRLLRAVYALIFLLAFALSIVALLCVVVVALIHW